MGLEEIREGLAANLADIPRLQESAYLLSDPTPPCAEIEPGAIDYDAAFHRGMDIYTLTVRVQVGISTDKGSQKTLDRMLAPSGAYSIKAAIESDATLGGACDDLHVKSCSGYRVYARDGNRAQLGAEWTVEVFASGQ